MSDSQAIAIYPGLRSDQRFTWRRLALHALLDLLWTPPQILPRSRRQRIPVRTMTRVSARRRGARHQSHHSRNVQALNTGQPVAAEAHPPASMPLGFRAHTAPEVSQIARVGLQHRPCHVARTKSALNPSSNQDFQIRPAQRGVRDARLATCHPAFASGRYHSHH